MSLKGYILLCCCFHWFLSFNTIAQQFPYKIHLDSIRIPELGGIQSYAFGQWEGKWLIVGGRLDGLHRRQPWAAFDSAGHNNQLIVVDPVAKKKWSAPTTFLSSSVREQLSSTNMEFKQVDSLLFLIGGYGYSPSLQDHITFPYLTVIDLSKTIDSIIKGEYDALAFNQIKDENFAVTGGKLAYMDSVYYLIGGHRFDGRYNPMGHETFVQTYTNAVLTFDLTENKEDWELKILKKMVDEQLLHRRDMNVLPHLMPNGEESLQIFSGVFQPEANLPYLSTVTIKKDTIYQEPFFAQYYNNYHCASLALYDQSKQQTHSIFFGGIAQYYDSSGYLVQDNEVPFVQTIGRVTRNSAGELSEYAFPIKMPDYLGAGSEFFVNPLLTKTKNGLINLNAIESDTILLGYIYGGIKSSAANIFWVNDGTQSEASEWIYPVVITKYNAPEELLNEQSNNSLQLQVYPNPIENDFVVSYYLQLESDINITVKDLMGQPILQKSFKKENPGYVKHVLNGKGFKTNEVYYLYFEINGKTISQKLWVH
jgi:hypothetical protein